MLTTSWKRIIFDPDHHLNDFCVFEDNRGRWHCVGIMGTGTWESERSFFHWTSDSLYGEYCQESPIAPPAPDISPAPQRHAPFVFEHDGVYHMFYRIPNGTIVRTWTDDPMRWNNPAETVFEKNDARDVHVLKLGDRFLMYYCQVEEIEGKNRSCILLRSSTDLQTWSAPEPVFIDRRFEDGHAKLESPCVVEANGGYYLFNRDRRQDASTFTVALRSSRPDRFTFDGEWLCLLPDAHALEVIRHGDTYYALRVSGAPHANPSAPKVGGWVDIAEMKFPDTNAQV